MVTCLKTELSSLHPQQLKPTQLEQVHSANPSVLRSLWAGVLTCANIPGPNLCVPCFHPKHRTALHLPGNGLTTAMWHFYSMCWAGDPVVCPARPSERTSRARHAAAGIKPKRQVLSKLHAKLALRRVPHSSSVTKTVRSQMTSHGAHGTIIHLVWSTLQTSSQYGHIMRMVLIYLNLTIVFKFYY